jgi:hypothetical protein
LNPTWQVPQVPPQPSEPHCLPAQLGTQPPWTHCPWALQLNPAWQVPQLPLQPSEPHCLPAQFGRQLHLAPHWFLASFTQMPSHELLQQNGSMLQTHVWTAGSLQPVAAWVSQQEFAPGQPPQSLGQVVHVSPPSHAPLPQQEPQSLGQVVHVSPPLHPPSPHTGPALQPPQPRLVTSLTQMPSHELLQQKGSVGHTHCSVASLSQPGLPWGAQQSPLHDPHWSASAAQRLSHWLLQQ